MAISAPVQSASPAANAQHESDSRTNREVITQWKKLQEIKRQLMKEGTVSGDATPADVLAAIRAQIPSDLLLA